MSELCGNSVIITWSNERREHVVTQHGAEIGGAFRTNDARAIAQNYRVECGYVVGIDFSRDPRDRGSRDLRKSSSACANTRPTLGCVPARSVLTG